MNDDEHPRPRPTERPALRPLNTPLGWPGASRALLLAWITLPLLVLGFMLSHTASGLPKWASIASPSGMTMFSVVLGSLVLANISIIALGMVLRGGLTEVPWYQFVVAVFVALPPIAAAYFLGMHINGFVAMFVAGSALCLLLLERWVALANIGTWVLGMLAMTALEQTDRIPHTAALSILPIGPGGLHTGWLLGPGLMSVLAGLVALLVLDQVASRERGYRAALHASIHQDPLSGLPDFSVLEQALHREIDRAKRHGLPLCVAVIELDNLDAINRTMGFEVGDALLKQVATRLSSGLRESDLAAGLGDGRFVLLLPHLESDHVVGTATRIVKMLNDQPIGTARSSIAVSARLGLASWEPGLEGLELLGRAAHALEQLRTDRGALAAVYGASSKPTETTQPEGPPAEATASDEPEDR